MLYNSVLFITIFLPVSLIGWYLLNRLKNPVFSKIFIVGMSLWFYGYYNIFYLWILLFSIFFNYVLSIGFCKSRRAITDKVLFWIGLAGNLSLLFYFKYFHFFVDNCNYFLHANLQVEKIALPLGISFFTFQQLSFVIDRYKKEAPHYRFVDYAFFVTFFPQLVAGPIVRHEDLIPQLLRKEHRRVSADNLFRGSALFCLGLSKKVLLADSLAVLVNAEYQNISWLDTPTAWGVIVFYMMELYFDFSGYSDMSRGIGRMLGIEIPQNFDSPFYADSVKDFWRRWHITLSRFLMKYVYIPLGGNRRGKARQCFNLFIVFLVSGIWHGANWTFVVWGVMHGIAVVFETVFPKFRFRQKMLNRLVTAVFVTLSFSVFRADSLKSAVLLWRKLFTAGFEHKFAGMCNTLQFSENYALRKMLEAFFPAGLNPMYVFTFLLLTVVGLRLLEGKQAERWIEDKGGTRGGSFILATLFVWSLISLSKVSVFLYFNF